MKTMKNLPLISLAPFLVALLLFTEGFGLANESTTLTLGSGSGTPGSIVSIPITLSNNSAIVSLQFDVVFDSDSLENGDGDYPTRAGSALQSTGFSVSSSVVEPGRVRVVIVPPLQNPLPIIPNGEIVTLPIHIKTNASEGIQILRFEEVSTSDKNCNEVPITTNSGEISVSYKLHTLTVTMVGKGIVTSDPSGIECGSTCSAQFEDGTQVTLTATPDSGSKFIGWSGDCSGCGDNTTCQVTMDADKDCTAEFQEIQNQLPVIDSFTANPTSGAAPLNVSFTCQAHDPDGSIAQYQIAFGDGSTNTNTTGSFTHTYNNPGTYQARCTSVDDSGSRTASDPITIQVVQIVFSIPYEANATHFEGGMVYDSNHLELAFIRPEALSQNVDLYISLTQPAAEGGTVTYYFQHTNGRVTLPNGIYFNNASPTTERMPYLINGTMPETIQLYGPDNTTPIFNDGWVIPAPTLCHDVPDGNYTFTVEAYEPGTDNLLARGEVTITLNRGCE